MDEFDVDFSFGTGSHTRYERIAGHDCRDYYVDWQERQSALPGYTTEPLGADAELSGHAVARLWIESSEHDVDIHRYLFEVLSSDDGRVGNEGVRTDRVM